MRLSDDLVAAVCHSLVRRLAAPQGPSLQRGATVVPLVPLCELCQLCYVSGGWWRGYSATVEVH